MKFVRFALLSVTLASGAAALTGCSGGGGSSSSIPTHGIGRFIGTYRGKFTGVVAPGIPGAGSPVSGTFTAIIGDHGNLTGTLKQSGFPDAPITGTIDTDGQINATADLSSGQVATLNGNLVLSSGVYVITGTFVTTSGGVTLVTGTIST